MIQTFRELVIGDVLVAPFVAQAAVALVIYLLLRPILGLLAVDRLFLNPPVARLGLFAAILATVVVLL